MIGFLASVISPRIGAIGLLALSAALVATWGYKEVQAAGLRRDVAKLEVKLDEARKDRAMCLSDVEALKAKLAQQNQAIERLGDAAEALQARADSAALRALNLSVIGTQANTGYEGVNAWLKSVKN